jgi:hypothetical protein
LKRDSFGFFSNLDPLMSAKQMGLDTLGIGHDPDLHIRWSSFMAFTQFSEGKKYFELLTPDNQQMAELEFGQKFVFRPRKWAVSIPGMNLRLANSRLVGAKPLRPWQVHFDGRYLVKSSKNAILVNAAGEKVLVVRKIGKDDLEIEMAVQMDHIILFFIGISAFLSPL